MRIVIAPDKFKGCLSAPQVARAISTGVLQADSRIAVELIPLADGGEGTVDALVAATAGRFITQRVTGPLRDMPIDAIFGMLGDQKTAVIEMAAASGLHLLQPHQYNPQRTTTYGTGELIVHAFDAGASQIILGIGGSATTDGGIGCAQACGVRFQMADGSIRQKTDTPLTGGDLLHITAVMPAAGPQTLQFHYRAIRVACDVDNPLYGPRGAAGIFGPQKGATPDQVKQLDAGLEHLASITNARHLAEILGSGAAGGLGFGLMALLNGRLEPGFNIIADAVGLFRRLKGADLVITAEGRLDASSLGGKTTIGVARLCKQLAIPCVALVGSVGEGAQDAQAQGLTASVAISDPAMPLAQSIALAPELLQRTAQRLVRNWPPRT